MTAYSLHLRVIRQLREALGQTSAEERISAVLGELQNWIRHSLKRGANTPDANLFRELWLLRSALWDRLQKASPSLSVQLLVAVWNVQDRCQLLGFFSRPSEALSLQYNVVARLVKLDAIDEALARIWCLHRNLKAFFTDKPLPDSVDLIYPPSVGCTGDDRQEGFAQVAVAIFVAIVTCCSRSGVSSEKIPIYSSAIQNLEMWLQQPRLVEEFSAQVTSALHYSESVLQSLYNQVDPLCLSQLAGHVNRSISAHIQLCLRMKRSPSSILDRLLTHAPEGLLSSLCWTSFQCLIDSEADDSELEALKLMNSFGRRCLRGKQTCADAPLMIKRLTEHERLPTVHWMAVHCLIFLSISVVSGNTVHLTRPEIVKINEALEKCVKQMKQYTSPILLPAMETMAQLAFGFKTDAATLRLWMDSAPIAHWIGHILQPFGSVLLSARDSGALESSAPDHRRQFFTQAALARIKIQLFAVHDREWSQFEIEEFRCLSVELYRYPPANFPVASEARGYNSIPREIRSVMECCQQSARHLLERERLTAAIDLFSHLCDLYASIQTEWSRKLNWTHHCLLSRLTTCVYQLYKTTRDRQSHAQNVAVFFQGIIAHLLHAFQEKPVDDIRSFVHIHTKLVVTLTRSENGNRFRSVVDGVLEKCACLIRRPESILRLLRCELIISAKRQAVVHPQDSDSTYSLTSPITKLDCSTESRLSLETYVEILSVLFKNGKDGAVYLQSCYKRLLHSKASLPYRQELLALSHALLFLFGGLCHQQPITQNGDGGGLLWAEEAIQQWNALIKSATVRWLDPEMNVLLLRQCIGLAHARGWLTLQGAFLDIEQSIHSQNRDLLTTATKNLCSEPLPIPYEFWTSTEELSHIEADLKKTAVDRSPTGFKSTVSGYLLLSLRHFHQGCMLEARKAASEARRFAMGLLKTSSLSTDSRALINSSSADAWMANGLYFFTLALLADIATEFEELTDSQYLIKEAMKSLHVLRSQEHLLRIQLTRSHFLLSAHNIDSTVFRMSHVHETDTMSEKRDPATGIESCTALLEMERASLEGQLYFKSGDPAKGLERLKQGMQLFHQIPAPPVYLELSAIELKCRQAVACGYLLPIDGMVFIVDYLRISSNQSSPSLVQLCDFLYTATGWKDVSTAKTSSDWHFFQPVGISEQLRTSLDLSSHVDNTNGRLLMQIGEISDHHETVALVKKVVCYTLGNDITGPDFAVGRILFLLIAWNLSIETSRFQNISTILGLLLASENHFNASAYFLLCSQGNGLRLQAMHHLKKKPLEYQQRAQLWSSLEIAPLDIKTSAPFLQDLDIVCRRRMDCFLLSCPTGTSLVTLAQVPSNHPAVKEIRDRLVVIRTINDGPPILALLPEKLLQSIDPYEDSVGHNNLKSEFTFSDVLSRLSQLLEENRQDFLQDVTHDRRNKDDLEKWWRRRLYLDQQIKRLIQDVERALGPWICLFRGNTSTDTRHTLTLEFLKRIQCTHEDHQQNLFMIEITSLLLSELKDLSEESILQVASFLCSTTSGCRMEIFSALMQFRGAGNEEHSTPVRVTPSTARKSGRIRRMRSTIKSQQRHTISAISPLPDSALFSIPVAPSKVSKTPSSQSSIHEAAKHMGQNWRQSEPKQVPVVIMILDFRLQQFPWESLSGLRSSPIYRIWTPYFIPYLVLLSDSTPTGPVLLPTNLRC